MGVEWNDYCYPLGRYFGTLAAWGLSVVKVSRAGTACLKTGAGGKRQVRGEIGIVMLLLFALSGCSATQSAFDKTAGNAASELAAAATTLEYLHQGKLTVAYARSSFVNFANNVRGVGSQLAGLQGAPPPATVRRLAALYRQAELAVRRPCLEGSCNWRVQVTALNHASAALIKASGG